jgi:hypothetical protein
MIRFLAIVISAGLIGVFILVKLFGGNDGPAYTPAEIRLAPKTVDTSIIDMKREEERVIRSEVSRRFADAPEYIVDLAVNIANPDALLNSYTDDILALTSQEVNQGYGQPFPNTAPEYKHTLLREAVISGNTGAAALLLDRGADVHYNEDEMPFQSVNLDLGKDAYDVWFPDYSIGSKFLRMWLDRGGDPNTTHPLYNAGIGTLLNHTPKNNLEATLSLLAFGADPWSPFEVTSDTGKYLYEVPGYFLSLSSGNNIYSEMAFRIALEGFYKNGPEEYKKRLRDAIEATASTFVDQTGTDAKNTLWILNKTYNEIFASLGIAPGPQTRRIMSMSFASNIGGFFLSEDEIRSPNREDQRVRDFGRQTGTEKWK